MTECKIGFIPKIRKCQNRHFSSVCPEKEPMIGEPCSLPSDVGPCSYGSECCCGECHPRSILDKSRCLRMGSFFLISNCQDAYIRRKQNLNLKHLSQQLESRMHRGKVGRIQHRRLYEAPVHLWGPSVSTNMSGRRG